MDEQQERELLRRAIGRYGQTHQILKCVEELSELQKELCKLTELSLTGAGVNHPEEAGRARARVTEETADVMITIRQLGMMLDNEPAVEAARQGKLERLRVRLSHR